MVALVRRKPGISREEFRAYYETNHAPLARSLFSQFDRYQRNYVIVDSLIGRVEGESPPTFPYDVITEFWFPDRAAYEAMLAAASQPDIGGRVAADEEKFVDRSSITMFLVEEAES